MNDQTEQMERIESAVMLRESEVSPDGLVALYLEILAATASHLNEWITFRAASRAKLSLSDTDFFQYMAASMRRLTSVDATSINGPIWLNLYRALEKSLDVLRGWSGDAATAVSYSDILFVSSLVLAKLSINESKTQSWGLGIGFALAAGKLPLPMDIMGRVEEQAKIAVSNLNWICGRAKR